MRYVTGFAFLAAFFGVMGFVAPRAHAQGKGLYADDTKDKTSGDLDDQDYWWAKWDAKMLDEAIKTRQPEGRISVNIGSSLRRLDDLAKKYPKHEEIQKWKKHFEEVEAKIDPNANRGESFKPGFPWGMSNFEQAWVNFQWGKMAADAGDVSRAVGLYQNVVYNLNLIKEHPDLFDTMPEEYKTWAKEHKPEAEKILADLKKKNH
jgi:hypothetical protein